MLARRPGPPKIVRTSTYEPVQRTCVKTAFAQAGPVARDLDCSRGVAECARILRRSTGADLSACGEDRRVVALDIFTQSCASVWLAPQLKFEYRKCLGTVAPSELCRAFMSIFEAKAASRARANNPCGVAISRGGRLENDHAGREVVVKSTPRARPAAFPGRHRATTIAPVIGAEMELRDNQAYPLGGASDSVLTQTRVRRHAAAEQPGILHAAGAERASYAW